MGLLTRGQAMLNRTVKAAGEVSVTYTRAATAASATLAVWVGDVRADQARSGQAAEAVLQDIDQRRDYLLLVADFAAAFGAGVEPGHGDRIVEVANGLTTTWDVRPADGEPAFRFSDTGRTRIRLHTRKVA